MKNASIIIGSFYGTPKTRLVLTGHFLVRLSPEWPLSGEKTLWQGEVYALWVDVFFLSHLRGAETFSPGNLLVFCCVLSLNNGEK